MDTGDWLPYTWRVPAVPALFVLFACLITWLAALVFPSPRANAALLPVWLTVVLSVLAFGAYAMVVWPSRRSREFRRIAAVAYYGRSYDPGLVLSFFWLVRRFVPVRRGSSQGRRLPDAHRWARQEAAIALLFASVMAAAYVGLVLWLGWKIGLVRASRPVGAAEAQATALRDVVWNALNAIPVLDLPATLHWERPGLYAEDRVASALLLLGKITIFVPTVAAIVALFKPQHFDPRRPAGHDPVVIALVDALALGKRHGAYDWQRALRMAAASLNSGGQLAPDGSTWDSPSLLRHVSSVRPAAT